MIRLACLLSILLLPGATPAATNSRSPRLLRSEFIFETAPFKECHASTIAETPRGLVAAWFGGTREKHPDVGIWLSREESNHWTAPIEIANGVQRDGPRLPCWNPVLFQPRSGPLLLFYKVGPDPARWWGMRMISTNCGESWSVAQRLPEGIIGPVKNKPVELSDGSVLCGASTEQDGWKVHFERTMDLGLTWQKTDAVNDGKTMAAIQPSILIHPGGKLQAVGRTRQGKMFEVRSKDNGKTWGQMKLTSVPNPNSGIDALTLGNGQHLVVYNHTTRGRSPLNVANSRDGSEWEATLVLEDEPGLEFSYPAVIQSSDGLVHITYTWKRQRIKHAVLDPANLGLQRNRTQ